MRKICSIIMAMSMVLVNVQSDITAAELTATDATERESITIETEIGTEENEMENGEIPGETDDVAVSIQSARAAAKTSTASVLTAAQWNNTAKYACELNRNGKKVSGQFGTQLLQKDKIIPGLSYTRFDSGGCSDMVPQAVCYVKGYVLISAYCAEDGEHNSVLYVLRSADYQYVCTLQLDITAHVGGMAYDPDSEYLWVCDSSQKRLVAYYMSYLWLYIHDACSVSSQMRLISTYAEHAVDIDPSFCTYADGMIWVGNFEANNESIVHGYLVTKDYLRRGAWMTGPKNGQGMAIYRSQGITYCTFATSYGRRNDSKIYSYTIDDYTIKVGSKEMGLHLVKTITMPSMMEGIAMAGGITYAVFESAANKYRSSTLKSTNPCDRVAVFSTRYIFK